MPTEKEVPATKEETVAEGVEATETEATETEATETDKVKVCANKEKYVKTKTAEGKASLHCGDAVATAFAGLSIGQKYALCSKITGVDRQELEDKYQHLNIGMQGMSLANRVRGAVNKDEKAKEPVGLVNKMNKLVEPIRAEQEKAAKLLAEKQAKDEAAAKVKAEAEKKAQAKADADAEK